MILVSYYQKEVSRDLHWMRVRSVKPGQSDRQFFKYCVKCDFCLRLWTHTHTHNVYRNVLNNFWMFRYKWIHVDVGETAWNCVILRRERNVLKARWIQWTVFKAMRRTGTSQVFFKRDPRFRIIQWWNAWSFFIMNQPIIWISEWTSYLRFRKRVGTFGTWQGLHHRVIGTRSERTVQFCGLFGGSTEDESWHW